MDKAPAVFDVLQAKTKRFPAQRVTDTSVGKVIWHVDTAAYSACQTYQTAAQEL
jgi:hypothetical protein